MSWITFIHERFPLRSHLPMVACFTVANVLSARGAPLSPQQALAAGTLAFAFLLRLRIFDELKDLERDRVLHPDRPLARGLISRGGALAGAAALVLLELAIAHAAGAGVFSGWVVAAGYSLLMYREFFAGAWLRPKVELYAVTHTFVAALLGATLAKFPAGPGATTGQILGMALANWMAFNVYEFSRKILSPREERPGVDSYSARLGLMGSALVVSLMATTAAIAVQSSILLPVILSWVAFSFARTPTTGGARLLRAAGNAFVIAFYAMVGSGL